MYRLQSRAYHVLLADIIQNMAPLTALDVLPVLLTMNQELLVLNPVNLVHLAALATLSITVKNVLLDPLQILLETFVNPVLNALFQNMVLLTVLYVL